MLLERLPEGFPATIPAPKFQIGDRVRWQPQPTEDFGTITGVQYAPIYPLPIWAWKYTIWLDIQSPSRLWVRSDIAWEVDLEPLPFVAHISPEG